MNIFIGMLIALAVIYVLIVIEDKLNDADK